MVYFAILCLWQTVLWVYIPCERKVATLLVVYILRGPLAFSVQYRRRWDFLYSSQRGVGLLLYGYGVTSYCTGMA